LFALFTIFSPQKFANFNSNLTNLNNTPFCHLHIAFISIAITADNAMHVEHSV